jgi:Tol biopolymer transport system component
MRRDHSFRVRHGFQLILLAAITVAAGFSAAASTSVPNARHATPRGSIVVESNRGIYRRYPGGKLKQLTTSADDSFPVWSRDGTRIAFERVTLGESCPLMVMNSDGSNVHQVGQIATDCSGAGWGPHDRRLIFGEGGRGTNASLWVVNVDGSGLRRLLVGHGGSPDGTHPAWSPNGRTIVFDWTAGRRVNGLLAIRPDGSHLHALVKPRRGKVEQLAQPTWSRDGKRLTFVRVELLPNPGKRTIMVATSSGRNARALARLPLNPGGMGTPSWSPNGLLIAFSGQCGQQACVWTIPSGGGKRRVLMRGMFYRDNWGPAGT